MTGTFRHVINMANSIIGVSILSMPYCFQEAGLVLGIILILLSGFITKKTCMFLIKAAIMSRRRSYELLAFQVFGVTGKLLVELCMILFLVGICISFHVVMGDLAPAIAAKYMVIDNSPSLRCTILVGMVLLVILPLCLLRNIDSLASMSACSIGFYIFLNSIIFYMASLNLLDGSWFAKAKLFNVYSAFRVLPIMTLALSCQSNVFEIYESIPDPDVVKMKSVVSQAVNICCALYIGVGFLGYVAFIDTDITGNVILKFPLSNMTDCITIFFVISLAISFPLIMFPCRTAIHSLIYKRNTQGPYDIVGNYIPEPRFKGITISVLVASLVTGILIPNIEFVLGLLGSTMGVTIALILPAVFYIKVYTKISCDRLLAQGLLLFGIFIMITGTCLHLSGVHDSDSSHPIPPPFSPEIAKQIKGLPEDRIPVNVAAPEVGINPIANDNGGSNNVRKEPVVPEPPNSDLINVPKKVVEQKSAVEPEKKPEPPIDKKVSNSPIQKRSEKENIIDPKPLEKDLKREDPASIKKEKKEDFIQEKKEESLHPDAIQKEEKEKVEENIGKENIEQKQEEILKKMESQQKEQKLIIEEQKKILKELIVQKEKIEEVVANPAITKEKTKVENKNVDVEEKAKVNQKKEENLVNDSLQKRDIDRNVGIQKDAGETLNLQVSHKYSDLKKQEIADVNAPNDIGQKQSLKIIKDKLQSNNKKESSIKFKTSSIPSEIKDPSIRDKLSINNQIKNPIKKIIRESNIVKKAIKISDDDQSLKHDEERKKREVSYPEVKNEKEKIPDGINLDIQTNMEKNSDNDINDRKDVDNDTKDDRKNQIEENNKQQEQKNDDNDNPRVAPQKIDLKANEKRILDNQNTDVKDISHLSYNDQIKAGDTNQQVLLQEDKPKFDPLYESRHLLWLSRRTRRRKRRHEQFPEYWDEM